MRYCFRDLLAKKHFFSNKYILHTIFYGMTQITKKIVVYKYNTLFPSYIFTIIKFNDGTKL